MLWATFCVDDANGEQVEYEVEGDVDFSPEEREMGFVMHHASAVPVVEKITRLDTGDDVTDEARLQEPAGEALLLEAEEQYRGHRDHSDI